MARRIRWARRASEDLIKIAEHIARDSRGAAARFTRRILETSRSLENLPRRGRRVPDLEPPDLRELLIGDYRMIYRVDDDDAVSIAALVHGARDLVAVWEREGRDEDT